MNQTQNVGRCPRCRKFLIGEESASHICNFEELPIVGCEEIVLDRLSESGTERNGDHVYLAWGKDNILYRLLVCNHRPAHTAKRNFTDYDTKQGLDSTLTEQEMEKLRPWTVDGKLTVLKEYSLAGDGKSTTNYCALMQVPDESWLSEDFEDYNDRSTVSQFPLYNYLPPTGRISKDAYANAIKQYIDANRGTVAFHIESRKNPAGFKQVLDGYLPELHLVPAVRDVADETKTSSATTLLGRLVGAVIERISQNNPSYQEVVQSLQNLKSTIEGPTPEQKMPEIREIIRLGRKYGFGEILATQLATEIPNKAMANAGTIVAMKHQAPQEVNYVTKLVNLSKPELQIYRRLPIGGAFIKLLSDDIPRLVKIQKVSPGEISGARSLTEQIEKERPSTPIAVSPPKARHTEAMREADRDLENLTSVQRRILRFLETSPPVTEARIREKFPEVDYREMLELLDDLEKEGLVQEQKVANLEGKGTVFYGALKAAWLQSESLEHRAMIQMIMEALAKWHPIHYGQTKADSPDIGLESMNPKGCIEVETGRKKLTPVEIDDWAKGVKERDTKLGYKDVLIVVPNTAVELHYRNAAAKYGLQLTTMAKLGEASRS